MTTIEIAAVATLAVAAVVAYVLLSPKQGEREHRPLNIDRAGPDERARLAGREERRAAPAQRW